MDDDNREIEAARRRREAAQRAQRPSDRQLEQEEDRGHSDGYAGSFPTPRKDPYLHDAYLWGYHNGLTAYRRTLEGRRLVLGRAAGDVPARSLGPFLGTGGAYIRCEPDSPGEWLLMHEGTVLAYTSAGLWYAEGDPDSPGYDYWEVA